MTLKRVRNVEVFPAVLIGLVVCPLAFTSICLLILSTLKVSIELSGAYS
jgi:hypothetical protein